MIPMNRQHSFLVQHPPADKARAIVVLFGWWGASTKHLNKYAELYQERGFQTIQVILDKNAILLIDTPAVENCALRTIDKTAKAIRHYSASSDKKIPVIFHAFSNGGAYVVERVEHFIRQEILKKELGDTDVSLVGDHLQGEIFDSAPAWPSTEGFDTAMSSVFTNALARFVVAKMAFFAFLLYSMWCMVRGVRQYRWIFWHNMTHTTLCTKQAFIYSPADVITDTAKLEELIAARRKKNEHTEVKCFEDSPHVLHLRKHPSAYKAFVDDFLQRIVGISME